MNKNEELEELEILRIAPQNGAFYDHPRWNVEDPVPIWFDWYDWSTPLKSWNGSDPKTSELYGVEYHRTGFFRYDRVKTTNQKIWFLKGFLEGKHCGNTDIGKGVITFANSTETFEFVFKTLMDVARIFGLVWDLDFEKSSTYQYCPIINRIKVSPSLLEKIRDYEYKEADKPSEADFNNYDLKQNETT